MVRGSICEGLTKTILNRKGRKYIQIVKVGTRVRTSDFERVVQRLVLK